MLEGKMRSFTPRFENTIRNVQHGKMRGVEEWGSAKKKRRGPKYKALFGRMGTSGEKLVGSLQMLHAILMQFLDNFLEKKGKGFSRTSVRLQVVSIVGSYLGRHDRGHQSHACSRPHDSTAGIIRGVFALQLLQIHTILKFFHGEVV